MGLDTTHNAWHGAYSAFYTWRKKIAEVAGLPPLILMEGFYYEESHNPFTLLDQNYKKDDLTVLQITEIRKQLPIKWDCLKPNPLYKLLYHSDCDGYINWSDCKRIANELMKLLDKLPNEDAGGHIGNWREKTNTFINGLLKAHNAKEKLEFH